MIAPGLKQIIQVEVTSYCDLHCSNCTRMLDLRPKRHHMSLENVKTAFESLADWVTAPGRRDRVVAAFGGNPCVRPDFPEMCRVIQETGIPKRNLGLWSNNVFGYGPLIDETFGYLNIVVHGVEKAAKIVRETLPRAMHKGKDGIVRPHGELGAATHGSIMVAMRDYIGQPGGPKDEAEMWEMIENCDIGVKWSGIIAEKNDGTLGAWFCEVANTLSRFYPEMEKLALPVEPGWWKRPMEDFSAQHKTACPMCGVPLRLKGHEDAQETDDLSPSHRHLAQLKPRRKVIIHEELPQERCVETTDYLRNRTPK